MTSFNGEVREEQKPLCEKYKISIKSNLGMGNFGFKNGTIEEIYSPDDLKDDMDEVSLTKRLEKHRASGKSLIAKLANGDGVIMISPSSQYTISVGNGEKILENILLYIKMTEYEITEIELNGEIVASYNSIKRILEYKAPQEEIDTLNQKIMNKRRMGIKPGLSLEGEFETLEIKDIKEIRPLNIV